MGLVYLCIKIFLVRILDVALGTFRVVLTVKGKALKAMIIGFVEVTIWFLVVKDALNSEYDSFWIVMSYAGGFAIGTYVGSIVSGKFITGKLNVQIIIDRESKGLINILREKGYAVSVLDAKGYQYSDKLMLFMGIENKQLTEVEKIIEQFDSKAFVVVSESKYVQNGYFGNLVK